MADYKIDYHSTAMQEAEFMGDGFSLDDLVGFSYIESFISNLSNAQFAGYNCILFLLDFEYDKDSIKNEPRDSKFIGTFDFEVDEIDPSLWGG